MRIGVPGELKEGERRVGLAPAGVAALVADGHEVRIEAGAGSGAGLADEDYRRAGARVVAVDEVWRESELLVKVKEPIASEHGRLRAGQTLFAYLHLAADRALTEAVIASRVTAIAYETVQDERGLPLLAPMSEIAGRLAAQAAAQQVLAPAGGPGILLGGSPGVAPARVVIIGGGAAGTQAALIALGLQAEVTILDTAPRRIRELAELFGGRARILASDPVTLSAELAAADVVIGCVLIPGARAPKIVRADDLPSMKPDVVLVDIAIDQGGCFETSRPTTYADPVFRVAGRLHYCVANLPAGVPRTATHALTNATLPYVRAIARLGVDEALAADPALAKGLNARDGSLAHPAVAAAFPDLAADSLA